MNIKLLRENSVIPKRATMYSAGFDLVAIIDEKTEIKKGVTTKIPTGIAVEIPVGYVGLVFARSGLGANYGVIPANAVGVIDSDYRGEIFVPLTCHKEESYIVEPMDRIAQLVVVPIFTEELTVVQELNTTERNDGGFNSTGKK